MCFCAKIKQFGRSGFKPSHVGFILRLALLQLMLIHFSVNANNNVFKGLTRTRSSKIASIHGLQAAAESLPPHAIRRKEALNKSTTTTATATAKAVAGRYEIHAVSGEPNYKSVNLTWEVEFVAVDGPSAASVAKTTDHTTVTNSSAEVEPPKAFQIFYCELQSFGPHRCRSKLLDESLQHVGDGQLEPEDSVENNRQSRRYTAQIDNLRMATRYSFHIRPQQKHRNAKITGRSEIFSNEIEEDNGNSNVNYGGQTIVIPTKGFSAQATKCLPYASEIEVETGPYFGGKIVVDGGNCGIKGNANDALDKYTMRIDHKLCGSLVKPETNTVETFITVQENLGIFTHSTRRFVVVCSFQSGMQTVRASFTVPGKEGVASAVENDPFEPDDRMGREHRQLRYVDKSGLVLKDSKEAAQDLPLAAALAADVATSASEESEAAVVQEIRDPLLTTENRVDDKDEDRMDAVAVMEDIVPGINEDHIKHEELQEPQEEQRLRKGEEEKEEQVDHEEEDVAEEAEVSEDDHDKEENYEEQQQDEQEVKAVHARLAKYAKLVVDQREPQPTVDEWIDLVYSGKKAAHKSTLHLVASNIGSVVLTIALSVIMIGVFVYVVLRETRRQTLFNATKMRPQNRTRHEVHNKQQFLQHKQLQQQQTERPPQPRQSQI